MLVLLHVLAIFLLVGLGFYVFVSDPRRRANQTFAAFIAFLAIWTIKDLTFWSFYARDATAGWWVSASFIIALLMQYSLAVFAWVFPENSRTPKQKALVLFAPGVVLIPATILGLLWTKAGLDDGSLVAEFTPLAYAFVVYVYVIFIYGAFTLFQKYRKYRGTQTGQQVGAILWALAITFILKTTANIIFPLFGNYSLLPLSAIFVLPGVLIYAYAILNFRLFSFQSALNQFRLFPITYKVAISIASVAVTSFIIFQIPIVYWAFRNGMDYESWRRYLVFSVISALAPNLLLILLILRSISRPLQRITIAALRVTRGEYGTEVEQRFGNDELGVLANAFNEMSRKMAADIREMQTFGVQLVRTEKLAATGTLAAGVAHEINNPLASISSIVQMMLAEKEHRPETLERLNIIAEQIDRIKHISGGLTNFSTPNGSEMIVVDIDSIIDDSLVIAGYDPAFSGLAVKRKRTEIPAILRCDPEQIQQVFINIFLNARDAMPNGGTIEIETVSNRDAVICRISDNGPGFAPDVIGSIFDPFFSTKPTGTGTGLGLSVCVSLIEAHGGTITADNRDPHGAIFEIKLPTAR